MGRGWVFFAPGPPPATTRPVFGGGLRAAQPPPARRDPCVVDALAELCGYLGGGLAHGSSDGARGQFLRRRVRYPGPVPAPGAPRADRRAMQTWRGRREAFPRLVRPGGGPRTLLPPEFGHSGSPPRPPGGPDLPSTALARLLGGNGARGFASAASPGRPRAGLHPPARTPRGPRLAPGAAAHRGRPGPAGQLQHRLRGGGLVAAPERGLLRGGPGQRALRLGAGCGELQWRLASGVRPEIPSSKGIVEEY